MNWNIRRSEVSGIQHGKKRQSKLKEKLKHRKQSEQSWIILEEDIKNKSRKNIEKISADNFQSKK